MSSVSADVSPRIKSFFKSLPCKGTLFLTTFGLDEFVLERLLRETRVPRAYPIYVFHDIIRHRNPGLLRHSFPAVKTIAIRLPIIGGHPCPVFHSKVWAVLSPQKRICRLAIHSINLTRYHLSSSYRTLESFWLKKGIDLPLPHSPLFQKMKDFPCHARISMRAETWVLDVSRDGTVSFRCSRLSAGEKISKATGNNHSRAPYPKILAAAPFFNISALHTIFPSNSPEIHSGILQDPPMSLCLHAKIISLGSTLIAGSPNLTRQALRPGAKPVNHETVLILNSGVRSAAQLLKKFPIVDGSTQGEDVPGDDPDLLGKSAWDTARRLAEKGPRRLRMEWDSHKDRAWISVLGGLSGARILSIQSESTDGVSGLKPISLTATAKRIDIPLRKQAPLAMMIINRPPIFIEGKASKTTKPLWKRELDLGDLWTELQAWLQKYHDDASPQLPAGAEHSEQKSPSPDLPLTDIRKVRDSVRTHESNHLGWLRWILKFQRQDTSLNDIPPWILDLKKDLKAND